MRRLTLEERVTRLERLINRHTRKNEFLGVFSKPKRSDEKEWVSKLFSKYPSIKHSFETDIDKIDRSTEDDPFNVTFTPRDKKGVSFVVSTKGDRGDMYCTVLNDRGEEVSVSPKFHLDKELNQCAMFMLETLKNKQSNEGRRRRCKYENIPLTTFDCGVIEQTIKDSFDDLPEVDIEVTDDNSDYGFLNVGIYNPEYVTSYDIIVNEAESVDVEHEGKKVGTAESIEDAADMLAEHFMKDYINGKYKNKDK